MRNKGGSGEIKETEDIKPQKFIAELEQNTHKGRATHPRKGRAEHPQKGESINTHKEGEKTGEDLHKP